MPATDRLILAQMWIGQGPEEAERGILTGEFNTTPGVVGAEEDIYSGRWLDTWEDMTGEMTPDDKAKMNQLSAALATPPEERWSNTNES